MIVIDGKLDMIDFGFDDDRERDQDDESCNESMMWKVDSRLCYMHLQNHMRQAPIIYPPPKI